jgi:ribosomal protein S16
LPIDTIGVYQPLHNPVTIKVDEEKAIKWLKEGAIPSTTVRSIFKKQGILKKLHEEQFSQAKKKVKTEKIATEKQEETPDIKSSEESSN